ncbi:MAG: DUF4058 family protein [Chloroflexota bacterium]|nr:DUF4058 family protein [Chloroflexota bacterium]
MTQKNAFPGVNPILNSYLLNKRRGWIGFHGNTITKLMDEINSTLPPGYYATSEESLQITFDDDPRRAEEAAESVADVMVYRDEAHDDQRVGGAPAPQAALEPTLRSISSILCRKNAQLRF